MTGSTVEEPVIVIEPLMPASASELDSAELLANEEPEFADEESESESELPQAPVTNAIEPMRLTNVRYLNRDNTLFKFMIVT